MHNWKLIVIKNSFFCFTFGLFVPEPHLPCSQWVSLEKFRYMCKMMPMVVPSRSVEITQISTIDLKIVVSMVERCAAYLKKKSLDVFSMS